MTENEFILEDRKSKIKSIVEKYGEENFYISFSGGKDSTVLHNLIDLALPCNKIPRVYANTGIELNMIRDFVFDLQKKDDRIKIIKPSIPIKPMLEKDGYPFKSKKHSAIVNYYNRNGLNCKTVPRYLGEREGYGKRYMCPNILRYQFTDEFKSRLKISDKCCLRMKEEPLDNWAKEHNKNCRILGIMPSEGGRRRTTKCLAFKNNGKILSFHPLAVVNKEWENWFIKEFNIDICDLYKPPYNFNRTGCKGCPFAIGLQEELDTLEKFFPQERKQCEYIWKPVYDEYRRLGYRLRKDDTIEGQMSIEDFLGGKHE